MEFYVHLMKNVNINLLAFYTAKKHASLTLPWPVFVSFLDQRLFPLALQFQDGGSQQR